MEAASFALIVHDLKNALGSLEGELEALILKTAVIPPVRALEVGSAR
jgi:hypothetical protein